MLIPWRDRIKNKEKVKCVRVWSGQGGLNESSVYLLAGYVKVKGGWFIISLSLLLQSVVGFWCCCWSAERAAGPPEG